MSPIPANKQASNITEDFLRENESDIRRLSLNAVAKYTRVPNDWVLAHKDEFINEMLFKVWHRYDPDRGALSTFVHKCAVNLIKRMYGAWCAETAKNVTYTATGNVVGVGAGDGSRVRNHGKRTSENLVERMGSVADPSGGIDGALDAVWASELARTKMTKRQAQVFTLLCAGVTGTGEIARLLGVNDKRVSQLKEAVRKIVKADQDAVLEAAGAFSFAVFGGCNVQSV